MSNKNHKIVKDESRREQIKKWIREQNGADKADKSLTDIFYAAVNKFIVKGYKKPEAEKKALAAISIFIPEGYGVGREDDGSVKLVKMEA